ncbi:MAG: hypothetical protein Q8O37_16080, partial [Sulfuricellaceae bacterium]|nr:hypothetical protein [Sulfuricellaceae bacterium]
KAELFWGRIGIRASTSSHFLRICFLITRIISNAYFVIRPVCAKFRLEPFKTHADTLDLLE